MRSFEQALHLAQQHHHLMHRAFTLELVASFCRAQGLVLGADSYAAAAAQAWDDWGAAGKADWVRAATPALRETAAHRPVHRSLELSSVLQASELLSRQRDPARLVEVLFETAAAGGGG